MKLEDYPWKIQYSSCLMTIACCSHSCFRKFDSEHEKDCQIENCFEAITFEFDPLSGVCGVLLNGGVK